MIQVDLLEPVSHFLDVARINLAPENWMVTDENRTVNFFFLCYTSGRMFSYIYRLKCSYHLQMVLKLVVCKY